MGFAEAVADYHRATEELLAALADLPADGLDAHVEGGWSARQVIHHLADSETTSYLRLRRLLVESPDALIQGYDEAAWAACDALGYTTLPVEHSVAVVTAVRRSSFDLLSRLGEADLERRGVHSESGPYTLGQWLEIYTRHPRDHRAQLLEALAAR
ncbi:MAG: DinB family protein [Acidobacteriota bacterium]|nr:DinB family protein [Acidobacteriota bacterium]